MTHDDIQNCSYLNMIHGHEKNIFLSLNLTLESPRYLENGLKDGSGGEKGCIYSH